MLTRDTASAEPARDPSVLALVAELVGCHHRDGVDSGRERIGSAVVCDLHAIVDQGVVEDELRAGVEVAPEVRFPPLPRSTSMLSTAPFPAASV